MFSMKDIVFGRERVERRSHNGKKCACPKCGKRGRRIRTYTRVIRHIAYDQVAWIIVEQGEYVAKCDCCKKSRAPIRGVPQRGHYTIREESRHIGVTVRMVPQGSLSTMPNVWACQGALR
jgi:hypothetical protein